MDGGEKMNGKPGKNSSLIIYMLCSAAVVAAATFYFQFIDAKENTTTVIINKSATTTAVSPAAAEDISSAAGGSSAPVTSAHTTSTEASEPVTEFIYLDINSASRDELVKLGGIGNALADAIIGYREEHGGFRNIEEIMEVPGIGKSIFSDISGHIYVPYPVLDNEEATEESVNEPEPPTEHQPTLDELAPININTADIYELMLLPHVDEETAWQIIKLREDINGFGNTYELAYVEALTKSQVNDILPYVVAE